MRIAVFGSGAVGGYFGGRLAEAGNDVTFIARGGQLRAIQTDGLHVTSIAGDFSVHPAKTTDDPSSIGIVDVVLVGVKAWQIVEAAGAMRPLIGPNTIVVPLENGIEAPAELASVVGDRHALGGLCRILAFVTAPGRIQHAGIDPYIAFGELDGSRSDRAERLRDAFNSARAVKAEIPDDIRVAMWNKFLLIASWSGLGALTRLPIGIIRSVPETRELMLRALREICAVAAAQGVSLPPESVERAMAFVDALPPDGTTSMQRDIMSGRPSELDAQMGAVVRLGSAKEVDVSLHRIIYAALRPSEEIARGNLAK
ncbi:MAG: 2-dehydropantoate 2-reductase [Gemmatimonadaceae bacterium]